MYQGENQKGFENMSYSCFISFKTMDESDIFPFLVRLKHECTKHLKDIAKSEYCFCPHIRKHLTIPDDFADVKTEDRQESFHWAYESVFKYKFFYNEDLHLLGMFSVPRALYDFFDGTIHFQDSTDQDYDSGTWKNILQFKAIYQKWMDKTDAEVKTAYLKEKHENFDEMLRDDYPERVDNPSQIKQMLNYYRRSFCYDEIWQYFRKNLFDDEDNVFLSVYGGYETREIMLFVKHCHDAFKKTI